MNPLVNTLVKARSELLETVDKIDQEKADKVIIGNWNLKDIIAHLTGWAEYQIAVLKAIRLGKLPPDYGNVQDYNQQSTRSRKDLPWDRIYEEYKEKSQQLVEEYKSLPDELWTKPIERGKKPTMEKLIKIETRHYAETHLPQIKKLLED